MVAKMPPPRTKATPPKRSARPSPKKRPMVMVAETFTAKGARYLTRGTWTPNPDGSVRQQFEISTDEGKTWQLNFDGLYRRKTPTQ